VRGRNRDYVGARKVWNGTFEAEKYAGYAQAFEAALEAGGWNTVAPPQRPVERPIPIDLPAYPDTPEKPQTGLIAALLRLLAAIFGRKDKT
uniref:hypothetical protein n=1 Tax=Sulfitobacter sp. TaxID=1903071 RepID=UPI003F6AD11D